MAKSKPIAKPYKGPENFEFVHGNGDFRVTVNARIWEDADGSKWQRIEELVLYVMESKKIIDPK